MARASRETIYAALFELLGTVSNILPDELKFKTSSRKLVIWDEVPSANQPALFLKQDLQRSSQVNALALTELDLDATVWIYFEVDVSSSESTFADQYINAYIDAVEKVLDPMPGNLQQLGGVCYHCWIEGTIAFDDGVVDKQGVIMIPIKIKVGV